MSTFQVQLTKEELKALIDCLRVPMNELDEIPVKKFRSNPKILERSILLWKLIGELSLIHEEEISPALRNRLVSIGLTPGPGRPWPEGATGYKVQLTKEQHEALIDCLRVQINELEAKRKKKYRAKKNGEKAAFLGIVFGKLSDCVCP